MRHARLSLPILAVLLLAAAPAFAGQSFTFSLFADEETPPVASNASGRCVAILSDDESAVEVHCTHTIANPTAAHIHLGARGVAGPIVFPFTNPASPLQGTFTLTAEQAANLLVGNFYVNVHTAAHPAGEIRGQMTLDAQAGRQQIFFPLTGAQETPPVATTASGRCLAVIEQHPDLPVVPTPFDLHLTCVHSVAAPTAAHIHQGATGVAGPIVFSLGTGTSPIRATWSPVGTDVEDVFSGLFYVNVHTAANPNGEIRGQIAGCFADDATLCLLDGRFRVRASWETATNSGAGHAVQQNDESGQFWFFSPGNTELTVKVLDACSERIPRFWVFASGLTNVEVVITVVDTKTNQQRTYTNPLNMAFAPVQDTNAFATCP